MRLRRGVGLNLSIQKNIRIIFYTRIHVASLNNKMSVPLLSFFFSILYFFSKWKSMKTLRFSHSCCRSKCIPKSCCQYFLIPFFFSKWRLHRKLESPDPEGGALEGVSIIKPLHQSQVEGVSKI